MKPTTTVAIDRGWVFRQTKAKEDDFLPVAQFPTNVHLDLLANGKIEDPFVAKNVSTENQLGFC